MLIDLGGGFHGSMQHVQITAHPLSRLIVAIKTGGRFSGKVRYIERTDTNTHIYCNSYPNHLHINLTPHTVNNLDVNNQKPNHTNHTTNQEDNALIILARTTTLAETQKQVLRKGLTFIPKPKKVSIQTLHTDIRNFMHRAKTLYIHKIKKNKPNPDQHNPETHSQ